MVMDAAHDWPRLGLIERAHGRRRAWVSPSFPSLVPLVDGWIEGAGGPPLGGVAVHIGGRGGACLVRLPCGERILVKPCLRGGMVRLLTRDKHYSRPWRPLRELMISRLLERMGIPHASVCAAFVEECGAGYRGWVASLFVEGAPTAVRLIASLGAGRFLRRVCVETARVVQLLHQRGVEHPDLNLDNFMYPGVPEDTAPLLVDFDKAVLHELPLSPLSRAVALERMFRSLERKERVLGRRLLDDDTLRVFLAVYVGEWKRAGGVVPGWFTTRLSGRGRLSRMMLRLEGLLLGGGT